MLFHSTEFGPYLYRIHTYARIPAPVANIEIGTLAVGQEQQASSEMFFFLFIRYLLFLGFLVHFFFKLPGLVSLLLFIWRNKFY